MKKIFLLLALLSSLMVLAQRKKLDPAPSAKDIGAALPQLRIVDVDSNIYTNDSLGHDKYLFLLLFNPSCGHCIDVGNMMVKNRETFKHTKVVFMAGAMMLPYMSTFYNATQIDKCSEYIVGVDSADVISDLYTFIALPQLNIYNKERKLVKSVNGNISMEALKPYLD